MTALGTRNPVCELENRLSPRPGTVSVCSCRSESTSPVWRWGKYKIHPVDASVYNECIQGIESQPVLEQLHGGHFNSEHAHADHDCLRLDSHKKSSENLAGASRWPSSNRSVRHRGGSRPCSSGSGVLASGGLFAHNGDLFVDYALLLSGCVPLSEIIRHHPMMGMDCPRHLSLSCALVIPLIHLHTPARHLRNRTAAHIDNRPDSLPSWL